MTVRREPNSRARDGVHPAPLPAEVGTDLASLPLNVWLVGQEGHATQRGDRYSLASVRGHPGKMLPALARRLVEEYTRPGDLVLDPLSGIGTVGVEAIRLGRRYLGVELEASFVAWQRENLVTAREHGAPGAFAVRQGDARDLPGLLAAGPALALPVDAILTSPPYADRLRRREGPPSALLRDLAATKPPHAVFAAGYGAGPGNLGNLPAAASLRELEKVYAGCLAVLKPGGLLAVVIRAGRNGRRLLPLHHETARLCMGLGFEFLDEVVDCLARVEAARGAEPRVWAHALFFRRLAVARQRARGFPITLEQTETLLLFRKPGPLPSPPLRRRPAPAGSRPQRWTDTAKAAVWPPLPTATPVRQLLGSGTALRGPASPPYS